MLFKTKKKLYFNNYFFHQLLVELRNKKVVPKIVPNAVGTIRRNRFHAPSLLSDTDLNKKVPRSKDEVVSIDDIFFIK